MNKLPLETRVRILNMLVEEFSMRSISRVCDVSINTVTKLLVDAGAAAEAFHDKTVRGLKTTNLQCDEIWSFYKAKKGNIGKMKHPTLDAGDIWTFTALDRDSKLIVTWFAGDRTSKSAETFLGDAAERIETPVQLSTDGFNAYEGAVAKTFGARADSSYGQIVKKYGATSDRGPERKYNPGVRIAAEKEPIFGSPDKAAISTSHVERMNLNMRMGMRRFTRLTNAFSKKFDNHLLALALYFFHYNFCRIHKSLRTSPAQAAGVTDELLSMEHLCQLIDAAIPPTKRGPYKKKAA
ncbi:MAG TPA: IS1 family transposase [Rhizomicrobium sp.]|jgi:IS1 family transposase|nr:IS1 family transposase [Rhizomicrobium sp.]